MDVRFERRAIELYEQALDWPAAERAARTRTLLADEPELLAAVTAMLQADAAAQLLPTMPAGGGLAALPGPPPPERIGPYRIVSEIGRGGMGIVYRAERDDGVFEQTVAIKLIRSGVFSEAALARFATERRILARLHHPHIAQLLDGGVTADGTSYIIMELIEGIPITDHAADHALDLAARLAVLRSACDAVEHAHRNLIVHADIKPSNVVVADMFGVKLLDFGIARLVGAAAEDAGGAHTPGYASPARIDGQPPVPADDIFALGKLMHALMAGVPGVDADLAAIADQAAADDPAQRYGAVSELIDDIERWQCHKPVAARPADRRRRAVLLWRRRRWPITVAAIALTLLIGTAIVTTLLYLRASAARATAEQRFQETRALSLYLINDVTEALAPLPGSGPIRRRIADRANHALAQLSRVPGASPDLRVESATAFTRVGELLANSDLREQAQPDDGSAALLRAQAELERLTAAQPQRADLTIALARTMVARARSLGVDHSAPREALRLIDAAAARLDRLLATAPANLDAQAIRWDTELARAMVYSNEGDNARNTADLPAVIAHYTALPLPHDAERALRLERGWSLLADAQWYLGDFAPALASYQQGLAALSPPAFAHDARVVIRQAYAAFDVASTLASLKRLPEALATIEIGVTAMDRLRSFDDGAPALHMQAIVTMEYATELGAVGRFDAAIAQALKSIAVRRAQARLQPESYEAQRSVPVGLRPLAELYRSAGRTAEACATLAETDASWDAVARHIPLSGFDIRDERPVVRKLRAKCP